MTFDEDIEIERHVECIECGNDLFDEGDYCWVCDDGPFCESCLEDHEEYGHPQRCAVCDKELKVDPPCPICHAQLCDDCYPVHLQSCRIKDDIRRGVQKQLTFYTFEDDST